MDSWDSSSWDEGPLLRNRQPLRRPIGHGAGIRLTSIQPRIPAWGDRWARDVLACLGLTGPVLARLVTPCDPRPGHPRAFNVNAGGVKALPRDRAQPTTAGGPGDSEQTQKALAGRLGSIGNWRLGIGAPGIGSRVLA